MVASLSHLHGRQRPWPFSLPRVRPWKASQRTFEGDSNWTEQEGRAAFRQGALPRPFKSHNRRFSPIRGNRLNQRRSATIHISSSTERFLHGTSNGFTQYVHTKFPRLSSTTYDDRLSSTLCGSFVKFASAFNQTSKKRYIPVTSLHLTTRTRVDILPLLWSNQTHNAETWFPLRQFRYHSCVWGFFFISVLFGFFPFNFGLWVIVLQRAKTKPMLYSGVLFWQVFPFSQANDSSFKFACLF